MHGEYVGKAQDIRERFIQHLKCHEDNHAKNEWIRELLAQGYIVRMETIERVHDSEVKDKEAYWIHWYQEQGAKLLNITIPSCLTKKITRKEFGMIRIVAPFTHISLVETFLLEERKRAKERDRYDRNLFSVVERIDKIEKGVRIIFLAIYSERVWFSLLEWLEAGKQCGIVKSYKQARYAELKQMQVNKAVSRGDVTGSGCIKRDCKNKSDGMRMVKLYNVWHIANNGDAYPIQKAIEESRAHKIADTLQDMSLAGLLPDGFYMASPIGKDIDWIERIPDNRESASVDYMQEYHKFLAQPVSIERWDYGH